MVQIFAEALMSADADAVRGAAYGQRGPNRRNIRNGYRWRGWETRAGSIELAVPKLREGSYFPDWLLERRRRAESALVNVVATSYLLGVSHRGEPGAVKVARRVRRAAGGNGLGAIPAPRPRPTQPGDAIVLSIEKSQIEALGPREELFVTVVMSGGSSTGPPL
jgi:hypothetical protein